MRKDANDIALNDGSVIVCTPTEAEQKYLISKFITPKRDKISEEERREYIEKNRKPRMKK